MRTKMQELQKRENKIIQTEEELKSKIQEVGRQLGVKEEEIINIKKRFKEEKLALLNDKKNLQDQLEQSKKLLDEVEERYRVYRKDMEESPLSVLRNELGKKNVEIVEANTRLQKSLEENAALNDKFKKLRNEHVKLRREIERQKDEKIQLQAEEIERAKLELKNRSLAEQERQELLLLKEEVSRLNTELIIAQEISLQPKPMYMTNVSEAEVENNSQKMNQSSNPFATKEMNAGTKITKNKDSPSKQQKPKSKLDELKQLREHMLREGLYTENDEMIVELDNQIKRQETSLSPARNARN